MALAGCGSNIDPAAVESAVEDQEAADHVQCAEAEADRVFECSDDVGGSYRVRVSKDGTRFAIDAKDTGGGFDGS